MIHAPASRALWTALATASVAIAAGVAVVAGTPSVVDAGVHWVILAALGAGSIGLMIVGARRDGLVSPLVLVGAVTTVYFVARPLQLMLSADALKTESYNYYATRLESVRELSAQEITLYVHTKLAGTLEDAFLRSLTGQLVFLAFLVLGFALPIGRRLAVWASGLGRDQPRLDVSWVIAAWLAIGLVGQAAVLAVIGGVGAASSSLGTQGNLAVGFVFLVILNFYTAGLILWLCWHSPTTRAGRIGLTLAILELACFYALLGSRTLVLIPLMMVLVARNELVREVRMRGMVLAIVGVAVFSSAYLSFRESAHERSFLETLARVPAFAVDVRPLLNASPVYDQFLIATDYVPSRAPYRYGGELAQGVLGNVPSFLNPAKPESNDISFRKLIWQERFGAGRPIGVAGEWYRDFGFLGFVVGGTLLGILVQGLTGLRRRAGGPEGREFRTAGYVVGFVLLFEFLIGSWSLIFGLMLEILFPLLLATTLVTRRMRR